MTNTDKEIPICEYYIEASSIIVKKPSYVHGPFKCKVPFLEKAYIVYSTDAIVTHYPTGIVVLIPRAKDTVELKIRKEFEKEILDLEKAKKVKILDLDSGTIYGRYDLIVPSGYYVIPDFKNFSAIYIGDEKYPVSSSMLISSPSTLRLTLKENPSPYKLYDYFCIGKNCREAVFALSKCPPDDIIVKFNNKYYNIIASFHQDKSCVIYSSQGPPIYYNPTITDFGVTKYLHENLQVLVGGISLIIALFILFYIIYKKLTKKQRKIVSMSKS